MAEHITAFGVVPVKTFKSSRNVNVNQVVVVATSKDNGEEFVNVFDIEGSLLTTHKVDEKVTQIIRPQSPNEMAFAILTESSVSLYKLTTVEQPTKQTSALTMAHSWTLRLIDEDKLAMSGEVTGVIIRLKGKPNVVLADQEKIVLISKDGVIETTSKLPAAGTRIKALQSTLFLHKSNKIDIALIRETQANEDENPKI